MQTTFSVHFAICFHFGFDRSFWFSSMFSLFRCHWDCICTKESRSIQYIAPSDITNAQWKIWNWLTAKQTLHILVLNEKYLYSQFLHRLRTFFAADMSTIPMDLLQPFQHLKSVNLSGNFLTNASLAILKNVSNLEVRFVLCFNLIENTWQSLSASVC